MCLQCSCIRCILWQSASGIELPVKGCCPETGRTGNWDFPDGNCTEYSSRLHVARWKAINLMIYPVAEVLASLCSAERNRCC